MPQMSKMPFLLVSTMVFLMLLTWMVYMYFNINLNSNNKNQISHLKSHKKSWPLNYL